MKKSCTLLLGSLLSATPLLNSWYTEGSSHYARLFEDDNAVGTNTSITTWSRGAGVQSSPTYGGVHQVSHDDDYVYVKTSGLGTHLMGPWYGGTARTNRLPNYPSNLAKTYAIPKTPIIPNVKTSTSGGAIGIFVDGVTMYDSRDAFSFDGTTDQSGNGGLGVWNSDAYVNEGATFDVAFAHPGGNVYHYHANAPALRSFLGDHVTHDAENNTYTENDGLPTQHSPILAWLDDGLPLYGPYGYSHPTDAESGIRKMITGFQMRTAAVGSARTTLPAWAARWQKGATGTAEYALLAAEYGPNVAADGAEYQLGHYLEDQEYKGDVGYTIYDESVASGVDGIAGTADDVAFDAALYFDLNEYNVRWCVTPEFPAGTWAYFTNIEDDGTPVFPYNVARQYFGAPVADAVYDAPLSAEIVFELNVGGDAKATSLEVAGNDEVVLTWQGMEGGTYAVKTSSTLADDWVEADTFVAGDEVTTWTDSSATESAKFYQAPLEEVAIFDETGYSFRAETGVVAPAKPNILLIIADDWGHDASPWDNPKASRLPTMQNLDDLVSRGLRFSNGYAQPTCAVTRASLLLGQMPNLTGIGNPGGATVPASSWPLPRVLQEAGTGYATGLFGKWHLGSGTQNSPDASGYFDEYSSLSLSNPSSYYFLADGSTTTVGDPQSVYLTTETANDAIAFIDAKDALNQPWLAWVAFHAPHSPFHEPPSALLQSTWDVADTTDRDLYEKMIEAMDTEIGRILAEIDYSETTVIVIGDNGSPGAVNDDDLYGNGRSKGTVYNGGGEVPFFIAGASVGSRGVCSTIVNTYDLYATILEIAGVDLSGTTMQNVTHQSTSLLPLLQGDVSYDGVAVTEQFGNNVSYDPSRSLRKGDYRLVIHDDPLDAADVVTTEFYRTGVDIGEVNNLLGTALDDVAYFRLQELAGASNTLGGGYDAVDFSNYSVETLYIEIDPADSPNLTRGNGSTIGVDAITIGTETALYVDRVNENDEVDQNWVKAYFDPTNLAAGTYNIIVDFVDSQGGHARVFTARTQYTKN